jgi:hypothetical protein
MPSKWLGIELGADEPNFLNLGVVIDDCQPQNQLLVSLTLGYAVMHSMTYHRLLKQRRQEVKFCERVVKRANEQANAGCERMLLLFDSALRIRTTLCVR